MGRHGSFTGCWRNWDPSGFNGRRFGLRHRSEHCLTFPDVQGCRNHPLREAIESARSRFPNVDFILRFRFTVHRRRPLWSESRGNPDGRLEHVEDDFRLTAELVGKMRVSVYPLATVPANPRPWSPHDGGRAPTAIRPNAAGRRMGRPACLRSISIPLQRSSISHCPRGQIMESLVAHDDRACRDGQQAAWSSGELGANLECSPARDRSSGRRRDAVDQFPTPGRQLVAALQVTSLAAPQNPAPQIIDQRQTVCS